VITQEEAKRILAYDPLTGVFTWVVPMRSGSIKAGTTAGSVNNQGYIHVQIHNKRYLGHRLAWLYVYGFFPENSLAHINHIRDDNRIGNLREVSNMCNIRNSKSRTNNTSGIRGVCWAKGVQRWQADVKVNGRKIGLGRSTCFVEAVAHRLAGEQALEWEGCDSSTPSYKYMQDYISGKQLQRGGEVTPRI
jgi:hypothetical protein